MDRETQAKIEIGHTTISRCQGMVLTVAFLVVLFAVPLHQHLMGWHEQRTTGSAASLSFYANFDGLAAELAAQWRAADSVAAKFLRPNAALLRRIDAYEDELDRVSFLATLTKGPVQELLCRLGAGNEKALLGRSGWLFFDPAVQSITGPGFLHPRHLDRRARSGSEYERAPQPHPVQGIVHFRNELRRFNCDLLVVPVPGKLTVHPDRFSARLSASAAPVHNVSYADFLERLTQEGVHYVDSAPLLAGRVRQHGAQYLATDTHWRPDAMTAVAGQVAHAVRRIMGPSTGAALSYRSEPSSATWLGDIAVMLDLPAGQTLYPPETVALRRILNANGQRWTPERAASILLLGDSFANIYSLEEMGWGSSAGFAEQLSFELGQPLDRIVRNDAGAYAAREMLAIELGRGQNRLQGKRLIVWLFAARELAVGDWKLIELNLGEQAEPAALAPERDGHHAEAVHATVVEVSTRPRSGAVYADFVMKLYVDDMRGADGAVYESGDGVVYVMAMRERVILPVASVQPGAGLTLSIRPWHTVAERYESMKTGVLDDVMLELEKPLYWGTLE